VETAAVKEAVIGWGPRRLWPRLSVCHAESHVRAHRDQYPDDLVAHLSKSGIKESSCTPMRLLRTNDDLFTVTA
jgi:hypothetical protein